MMVHQGSLHEQMAGYFTPFDRDVPRHWDMKALVRKMKKENIKLKKQASRMKTADENVNLVPNFLRPKLT